MACCEAKNAFAGVRVVTDRWIVFVSSNDCLQLLDCVEARLTEMAPPEPNLINIEMSVAGPCVAHRVNDSTTVTVVHISSGLAGTTVVRQAALVHGLTYRKRFSLIERGRSYVLYDYDTKVLQLVDLATQQCKRVFTPRECVWLPCSCPCYH